MNAFDQARTVEHRGMAVLLPFLQEQSDGRFVLLNKGPMAKALQEVGGDVIFNKNGRAWVVEIKIEQKHTGNLFLETWSNRNLEDRNSHAERGSNTGWLYKLRADLLFYYFIDNDHLYVFDLFNLKRWAFAQNKLHAFRQVKQGAYRQHNDTWGALVPLSELHKEVGFSLVFPNQLELGLCA